MSEITDNLQKHHSRMLEYTLSDDAEMADDLADALLIDVLRDIAEAYPELKTVLLEIIAAWDSVPKWYA